MNLNNVRIGPRMGIGFGAVLALMPAIVFVAHARLRHTSEGVHEMATQQKRAAIARE